MKMPENARKKRRPPPPWRWNERKTQAAQLLAEDELTDVEIGAKLKLDPKTLWRWKQHAEFTARIDENAAIIGEAQMRYAIARRTRRVKSLNHRWQAMHNVLTDRAADPSMDGVPGGKTGLMVRRYKTVGAGEEVRVVEEYEVDVGLLRQFLEHEKQAAQEVGQWVEKSAATTPDGSKMAKDDSGIDLTKLTIEELEAINAIQERLEADAAESASGETADGDGRT